MCDPSGGARCVAARRHEQCVTAPSTAVDRAFEALALVAANHHGLFRSADARACGISRDRVRTLVRQGWCEAIGRGVFRVRAAPRTGAQVVLREVWSHPGGAVASHRAAAYIWELVGYRTARREVTVARGSTQRASGRTHASCWLPDAHCTIRDGIPLTRVARTIFDLAGVEHARRMEVVLDDALARRLCTLRQVHDVFFSLARRGRRGTATMRALLEDRGEGYVAPASELERRARRIFREHGLPTPTFELVLGDDEVIGRVDCIWREVKLVVELDSQRHHGSRSRREADRRRDNRLVAAGWRVIRVTWDDLRERPAEVAELIRAALGTVAR